ncbi:MAG: hypothetical protein D8M57_07175 [Candidatus Scalindua sp. AMX11]|nr:MAG: hypothetical protein DWQ00_14745 [Candidatus Scalindua sp.]NOG85699.1 hypothetical protein [Planctomycetota bacterium]RZV82410.1 MAG: hypothetical protein EX341_09575 [Candidatus Scalindua sp. SCAELEC01]TDE65668.1 MAG: hypothetical protein D8M57_07175 [Candidatus Scalindua sp. AMX11]GJQ59136.1 MAG: hypothetical protein SCALA701_19370 [Candidatus Scalindua sp.]
METCHVKKRISVLLLCMLVSFVFFIKTAKVFSAEYWMRTYDESSVTSGSVESIRQTADGGFIAAGKERIGGGTHFSIFKLKSDGSIDWQKLYMGPNKSNWTRYGPCVIQPIDNNGDGISDDGYIVAGDTLIDSLTKYDYLIMKLKSDGTIDWQKSYGGTGNDYPTSIQQTSDGGYIVLGYSDSFSTGDNDAWVLKLDKNGSVAWQRTYGGPHDDKARSIAQTTDGGYIVTGALQSSSVGSWDMWAFKLDSRGILVWERKYGNADAFSIQQDSDGGYSMAGFTYSGHAGGKDLRVVKFNPDGNLVWQKTYGGADDDRAKFIRQADDGGYIVAGNTESSGSGGMDAWILKLNNDGTIAWQRTFGGRDNDSASSIWQTDDDGDGLADDGYVVAGYTDDSTRTTYQDSDLWVFRIDPNGEIGTSCNFITTSDLTSENSSDLTTNTSVNTIETTITGKNSPLLEHTNNLTVSTPYCSFTICEYSISPQLGSFTIAGGEGDVQVRAPGGCDWTARDNNTPWITVTQGSSGSGDGILHYSILPNDGMDTRTGRIYLYDQAETIVQEFAVTQTGLDDVWAKSYGGSSNDFAQSIRQTRDGGYIVGGTTKSFGAGNEDILVLKLKPDGKQEWVRTYGNSSVDFVRSIVQANDGGYVVLAYTEDPKWTPILMKLKSDGDVEWQRAYYNGNFFSMELAKEGYVMAGFTWVDNSNDLSVCKVKTDGKVDWMKTYGDATCVSCTDVGLSIQMTTDGGYIVAGGTESFGEGGLDIWVLRLDSFGDVVWQRSYGGEKGERPTSIEQTADSGYIVSGHTESFGTIGTDGWVLKLCPDGTDCNGNQADNNVGEIEWQKSYGKINFDYFNAIHQTSGGGYIVSGYTDSIGRGSFDLWLLKLKENGVVEWQKTYGGGGSDEFYDSVLSNSSQQTLDGGYVVAGGSNSFGSGPHDGSGPFDFWVLRTDINGDIGNRSNTADPCNLITEPGVVPLSTHATVNDTTAVPSPFSINTEKATFIEGTVNAITVDAQCSGINCDYSILPSKRSFDSQSRDGKVRVSSSDDCTWSATSNVSWITRTSGSSGTGDGEVNYSVSTNTTGSDRTGSMIIAGKVFTVTQLRIIDVFPPKATIVSPECGKVLTEVHEIFGTASDDDGDPDSDDAGIGTVRLQIQDVDDQKYLGEDGKWHSTEEWIEILEGTDSWSYDTSNVHWTGGKEYSIEVETADKAGNSSMSTESCSFSYSGEQGGVKLTLDLSATTILQNVSIDAAGRLTRIPDNGLELKGEKIELIVTHPDGEKTSWFTTTYDTGGHFRFEEVSDFLTKGQYKVEAVFNETDYLVGSQSDALTVFVGVSAGYAILVQGKLGAEGVCSHNKTTNNIYKRLKRKGFTDENIYYLAYEDLTCTGDGIVTVDDAPTKVKVQAAIEGEGPWNVAQKMNNVPAPLYLIMHDHGNKEKFYLENKIITPEELDTWLNQLENVKLNDLAKLEKRIIIYGACYSGSFIPALSKPSTVNDTGRVIVTSAATDEESYKGPLEDDGIRTGSIFLEEFFNELERGHSIRDSFVNATEKTEVFTRRGAASPNTSNQYRDAAVQHPLLDDNGDGHGSNVLSDGRGDGQITKNMKLGEETTDTNAALAEIIEVTETRYLDSNTSSAHMWAKTNDDDLVETAAWMEIRTPSMTLSSEGGTNQLETKFKRNKDFMVYNEEKKRWELEYKAFFDDESDSGMYEVYYFVKDNSNVLSPLKRSVVYKNRVGNRAPEPFNLLSPEDGSEQRTTLVFRWEGSTDQDSDPITYNLLIAKDIAFDAEGIAYKKEEIMTTNVFVDYEAGLVDGTDFYWKVQAVDMNGSITESNQIWRFHTENKNQQYGRILGTVKDSSGKPIVEAKFASNHIYRPEDCDCVSFADGFYDVKVDLDAYFTLECAAQGFKKWEQSNMFIDSNTRNKKLEVHIVMDPIAINADTVYVDFSYLGSEVGSQDLPFNTLTEGVGRVNAEGEVIIQKEGISTESMPLVIDKDIIIKSPNGTAVIGEEQQ